MDSNAKISVQQPAHEVVIQTTTAMLRINGEEHTVVFPVHHSLLEVIREECGLTGTKHGCELGECGACAVLLNGEPVLSCLVLAAEVNGKAIETIEGLQQNNALHPLQTAFADFGAAQCGYCIPAILMVARALLERQPDPSEEQIREALSGNLCRCTGYNRIVLAVKWAAAMLRGDDWRPPHEEFYSTPLPLPVIDQAEAKKTAHLNLKPPGDSPLDADRTSQYRLIGKPFRRVDARAKVTGRTQFADDLSFPRMVFVKLVRSTVPHANIKHIDCSVAKNMPGVVDIMLGNELPIPYGILPVSRDENALAIDKVRFVGDPIAAVAALCEDQAHAAALAVKVEYEILATIDSVQTALKTPYPRIHEYGDEGNLHKKISLEFGDLEAGFERAEVILEDTSFFQGNTHLPIEQHAAVAVPEDDDRVTLYSSTQTPHYVHRALARVLQMPAARIRVIACSVGGGFGGKTDPFNHEIVVAAMAMKLGRPVKATLTREEVFYCHRGRHPVLMHLRTGFLKDGTMTAQHLRTALDGGGYGSYGVASTFYTGALQTTTYTLPNYKFESVRAFTNKPPCGPKRGHGTPQPRFAYEVQLDKAAEQLGIDPAELRMRNLLPANSVTANWLEVGTIGLGKCIEAVVAGSGWKERYGKLPTGRGLGLACGAYMCGAGLPIYWNHMPQSGVQLKLDRSGGVAVFCGQAEIGQGSDSVLAVIVAEILGIDLADVRLCVADTDLTPVDLGSYSSRVTLMVGQAAKQAAERARDIIAKAVSKQLEIPENYLVFADNRVFYSGDPDKGLSFSEAVIAAEARFGTLGTTGSYTPPRAPGRYRGAGVGPSPTYSFTAAVLEVEVDPQSGLYTVEHVWLAHDIGIALNPVLVLGQIEGSVYMGLGEAMMEEQEFRRLPKRLSPALVHKTPSMLEYKSPGFHDMPEITSYLIETDDKRGPFGAKEVGQGPLLPIMPALANAIYDAVGVRVDQVPIHPNLVLKGLQAKAKGREARVGPAKFPAIDFGEPVVVHTPEQGGDGRAADDPKARRNKGVGSSSGTMKERDQALQEKNSASLTTD